MEHKEFDLVLWNNRKRNINLKQVYKIQAIDYKINQAIITPVSNHTRVIDLSNDVPPPLHDSYLVHNIEELKQYTPEPKKQAVISDCKKYRFALSRIWDHQKPMAMFIMLNPSTADAKQDDPTIRRCISFAKSWGYGGIIVCNLFPFRATNPKELLVRENISTQISLNSFYIRQLQEHCRVIILAWGNENILDKIFKEHYPVGKLSFLKLEKIHYLELSKNGTPKHPLYLPQTLKPQPLKEFTDSIYRLF